MNYNENQQISSNADNQKSMFENEINAYLKQQMQNRNYSNPQDITGHDLLNKEQGNSLLQNYLNNVCDEILKNNTKSGNFLSDEAQKFFDIEGRNEVINYLKNSNMDFDKDEIKVISDLVEKIENSAIERYLKQKARDKILMEENENAKQRLTSNAQNSGFNPAGIKTFTREQIGKMSSAEFAKNEKLIMDQLKRGLIQ